MAEERVQRRLAAIVAANVVCYSRLMGADEEGILARLKAPDHGWALRAGIAKPRAPLARAVKTGIAAQGRPP